MRLQILVCLDEFDDFDKGFEEGLVVAVVERLEVLPEEGNVPDDGEDVRVTASGRRG